MLVAFHSDIERIGDWAWLDLEEPAVVGREAPLFSGRTLGDPCLSRRQFKVSPLGRSSFSVRAEDGARLRLQLHDADGRPAKEGDRLSVGAWIAVEDRLLLITTLRLPVSSDADRLGLVGESLDSHRLRKAIRLVGAADGPTLVVGESGTGKELTARALHDTGPRAGRPFRVVNCATLNKNNAESELFGHRAGAFTGADQTTDGLFRAAHTGTLFLDEIGELPIGVQPKLLRVLEGGGVRRVGGTREERVDVRVVAATNLSLRAEIDAGRFRLDLYMRLRRHRVEVPPLRARVGDVPLLWRHFWARAVAETPALARFQREASTRSPPLPPKLFRDLLRHDWPGNIRELANTVATVAAHNASRSRFERPELFDPPADAPAIVVMQEEEERERQEVLAALNTARFNYAAAARALGISRTTLYKQAARHGIERPGRDQ